MRSPTLLGSGAVRRAVSIGAAGRRGLVDLLFSGALLFRAFPRFNLLFALGAAHGPLRRRRREKQVSLKGVSYFHGWKRAGSGPFRGVRLPDLIVAVGRLGVCGGCWFVHRLFLLA